MQKIQCLTGERKIAKGNLTQKRRRALYTIFIIKNEIASNSFLRSHFLLFSNTFLLTIQTNVLIIKYMKRTNVCNCCTCNIEIF